MMPQMKDHHTIKFMALVAERDNALHERNLALSEKKAALAERDMAILQRDAAIAERNNAITERDAALAALEHARESAMNSNASTGCLSGCAATRGATKHVNNHQHHHVPNMHSPPELSDSPYHGRDIHISEAYPISAIVPENNAKPRKTKHPSKESKTQGVSARKTTKSTRKGRRAEDLNKQVTVARSLGEWRGQDMVCNGDDLNKDVLGVKHEWKGQDLGLNHVSFDETTMPVPGCSCTGEFHSCYKWGNGGWQSSCCTTTISMYPLPVIPNKRHARIGGRKMSGSAFNKLLSRLAREGHDLSIPLDLKDHWAKHGTNRYITIR